MLNAGEGAPRAVHVWDWGVRLVHVLLLAGVLLNQWMLEPGDPPHRWVGYAVLALVAWRLVWGFVGRWHARFANFVTSPGTAAAYLLDLMRGTARRHLTHSPAGGWMVLALWAVLIGLGLTGWMLGLDAFWGSETVQDVHETLADTLWWLVGLHVAGVALASWRHRENLIAAMWHGRKPL